MCNQSLCSSMVCYCGVSMCIHYFVQGSMQEHDITCLATHAELVITACGKTVMSWKRGKQVGRMQNNSYVYSTVYWIYRTWSRYARYVVLSSQFY